MLVDEEGFQAMTAYSHGQLGACIVWLPPRTQADAETSRPRCPAAVPLFRCLSLPSDSHPKGRHWACYLRTPTFHSLLSVRGRHTGRSPTHAIRGI